MGLLLACLLAVDDGAPDKAKLIRAEIARLQGAIAKLEADLVRYDDAAAAKRYIGPVKANTYSLNIGDRGNFGDYNYYVEEITRDGNVLLSIAKGRLLFLVKGVSTTGLADHIPVRMAGVWEVTGTVRMSGTYYVVEPKESGKLVRVKR